MSENILDDSGEKNLWSGKTHFKLLAKPLFIQILLIGLHVFLGVILPTDTSWDWWNSWGPMILHGIIVIVELWYVIIPVLQWWNASYIVTTEKVIGNWGVFYKHSREIPLESIVSVSVERGILDRIFGCGTLVFQDAAAGYQPHTSGAWNKKRGNEAAPGVRFVDVPNILKVQKIIDQARYEIRRKR